MRILYNGHRARFLDPPLNDTALAQQLSFETKAAAHRHKNSNAYNKHWSGRIQLYNRKTKTFPSGLIQQVLAHYPQAQIIPESSFDGLSWTQQIDTLYPHQVQSVDALMKAPFCRGMIEVPTAGGKSWIIGELCERTRMSQLRVLVTVPGIDLLLQTAEELEKITGETVGRYGDKHKELNHRITVATIQGISGPFTYDNQKLEAIPRKQPPAALIQFLKEVQVWIVDECHGAAAQCFQIASALMPNALVRYGVTATLRREDNAELVMEGILGPSQLKIKPLSLVDQDKLCRPRVELHWFDHDTYETETGEKLPYEALYRKAIVTNTARTHYIVEQTQRLLKEDRGPVLVLFNRLEHGEELYKAIAPLCRTELLSGKDSVHTRRRVKREVEKGKLDVVIASIIWVTGVNIPILRSVIVAGTDKSGILTIQRAGRVLRTHPDKQEGLILDICDREWTYLKSQAHTRQFFYNEKYPDHVFEVTCES